MGEMQSGERLHRLTAGMAFRDGITNFATENCGSSSLFCGIVLWQYVYNFAKAFIEISIMNKNCGDGLTFFIK